LTYASRSGKMGSGFRRRGGGGGALNAGKKEGQAAGEERETPRGDYPGGDTSERGG